MLDCDPSCLYEDEGDTTGQDSYWDPASGNYTHSILTDVSIQHVLYLIFNCVKVS